jgi:hypothetical protein
MAKKERAAPSVVTLIDEDFGDEALVVQKYSDGVFAMRVEGPDGRLLLNEEQMRTVFTAFTNLGHELGWT